MRRPGRTIVLVAVLAVAAAGGGYALSHQIRERAQSYPAPLRAATPSALAAATAAATLPPSSAAPVPRPVSLAAALSPSLADPRLGGRVLAEVDDPATGTSLLRREGLTPAAPASTAKLATAAALLAVRRSTDRLSTRVVSGPSPDTVLLVGGGDPTLSAATNGAATRYPGAARIAELAVQIRAAAVAPKRVLIDDSLFAGPHVSPGWARADAPSLYAASITALMVDGARDAPTAAVRSADPAAAAGRALATALGLPATAVATGHAPPGATQLAVVRSPPLSVLVEQMLQQSDNVLAECLARQVALARGAPASFAGAAGAVRGVLLGVGIDIGTGLVDGSGLAAEDRIAPAAVTAVLRLGVSRPELATMLSALPVAGWSGTLADRFSRSSAVGVVRAKTGTLTSVSALAGVVHDRSGRLLSFALVADRVGPTQADTEAAEAALDAVAAVLAGCGCS